MVTPKRIHLKIGQKKISDYGEETNGENGETLLQQPRHPEHQHLPLLGPAELPQQRETIEPN